LECSSKCFYTNCFIPYNKQFINSRKKKLHFVMRWNWNYINSQISSSRNYFSSLMQFNTR
jgi:hypothetical protein